MRLAHVLRMALVAGFMILAGLTAAQEADAPFPEWEALAARSEAAIEAGRASDLVLEQLRAEIVTYRDRFEATRSQDSARLETLRSQLSALGAAPAESESEPENIAALRADLNQRIADLRVPVVVAKEAYSRADGLIGEIDRIIRERQTTQLLARNPSPTLPAHWQKTWREILQAVSNLRNETAQRWANPVEHARLRQELPQMLGFGLLGLLLVFAGRGWAERLGEVMRRLGGRGSGVWTFLVSLGRIILPLAGVTLITVAMARSGLMGLRGEQILFALPGWAGLLFGAWWLAERLFPRNETDSIFGMFDDNRIKARRVLLSMGGVLVLCSVVRLFARIENGPPETRAVAMLPLIVLGALLLLRLRQVIRSEYRRRNEEEDNAPVDAPRRGMLRLVSPLLSQIAGAIAIAAPVLSLAGYGTLAEAILFPFIWSLALLGLIMVLQGFLTDLYGWLSGKGGAVEESLFPVLTGFTLTLLALPVFALLWGARVADLTETWDRFLHGVRIGDAQISPTDFLTFAMVFVLGYTLTRLFQSAMSSSFLPRTRLDIGGQNAVRAGIGYVGIFLSALIAVSTAGIDLSSLAIVAGALSVGIGFGLQNIVSNFVSGIILLIERPISQGDWIEVGGNMGYVRDISVRSTRIETFDRTDVIVPNADLVSGTVTNYTRGKTIGRVIIPVGVAYGTDTQLVDGILREVAQAHPMVLSDPAPSVVFQGFGADALDFEIRAILRDVNWSLTVRSEINHEINRRFIEAGIEIPYAQRDIWIRNPETLVAGKPVQPPATAQTASHPTPPDLGDVQDGEGGEEN